ncbi:MAG: HupE/UreJ family protein [Pseudomonadales bacterium]
MIRFFSLAPLIAMLVANPVNGHVTEFFDHAHKSGVTYTAVGLAKGQVQVLYTVPRADLERIASANDLESLSRVVTSGFELFNAEMRCKGRVIDAVEYGAIAAWQFKLEFDCKEPLDFLRLHYDLFRDDSSHGNYTEIFLGDHFLQLVLNKDVPFVDIAVAHLAWERGEGWTLPDDMPRFPGVKPRLSDYFSAGFNHVLTGYDHLAFILALVMVLSGFAQLAWAITAFTLAHSVTLGISASNLLVPEPGLIEPIIAASIVYVGLENLFYLRRRYENFEGAIRTVIHRRWPVAFIFGLAHGFGFSYMLRDLGLPEGEFLISLASFNLGVEAGQLAVVGLPFIGLYLIREQRRFYLPIAIACSVLISSVGFFWLYERLIMWI